jgi:hypothetical protein
MTAEQKMDKMLTGIVEINSMLMDIAAPWGAAGSEGWYAEAMIAWDTIYTSVLNIATGDREIIRGKIDDPEPEKSKMALVNMFYSTFFQRDFLKYAQRIYAYSWRRDDVANKWALTLYQPPIQNAYPPMDIITSSAGRTSEDKRTIKQPKGGPYPPEMDNSVRG